MVKDETVLPAVGIAFDEGEDAAAFDLIFREWGTGECSQSGEDVDVSGEGGDVFARGNFAGPADKEGDAATAFIIGAFETFLVGVKERVAGGKVFAGGA